MRRTFAYAAMTMDAAERRIRAFYEAVMSTGNKMTIVYLTERGSALALSLKGLYPESRIERYAAGLIPQLWQESRALIFIMATGIVVRAIGPLLGSKITDPAVVVLDDRGRNAISLLGGHLGGANELASGIAAYLGGREIITTASEVNCLTPIDLWARNNGLATDNGERLPAVAMELVNRGCLPVFTELPLSLPPEFTPVSAPEEAALVVSEMIFPVTPLGPLWLRPRILVAGIGCNRGTAAGEIESAVRGVLAENNLSFLSLAAIATVEQKANEPGVIEFGRKNGLSILAFSVARMNGVRQAARSEAAFRALGVRAVAEPAAILASESGKLLVKKQRRGNVTVAIARMVTPAATAPPFRDFSIATPTRPARPALSVVGIGPGNPEQMTPQARAAIIGADVVAGYGPYLDLIADLLGGKEIVRTGMTREMERCERAIALARTGKTVALVSGGDPGIYALAGLVLEILSQEGFDGPPEGPGGDSGTGLEVEIIPGLPALSACAARLGAPLMHDFAAVSLSDRLTAWEVIEKRLHAAAAADFVVVLYNPRSQGRPRLIDRAREIFLSHRPAATPVGLVKDAYRKNEGIIITDLETMLSHRIDMQTTVIVGNSQTRVWQGRMITPRGYRRQPRGEGKS